MRIPFEDETRTIAIANGPDYGLVAALWAHDGARQQPVSKLLHCGQVFINNFGAARGLELPFGGVRNSGHGREKAYFALHEFSRVQTVVSYYGS